MIIVTDWLVSFFRVFFIPVPKTFVEESQKAKGKFVGALILLILLTAFLLWFANYHFRAEIPLFSFLAILFIFPIIFLFYVFCIHFIYQRVFHRKKYVYDEILYILVSIIVPFVLIDTHLSLIPEIGDIVSNVAVIYPVFLIVSVIHSICKLSIWQSIVTFFLATILGAAGFLCIPTFLLGLVGSVSKI